MLQVTLERFKTNPSPATKRRDLSPQERGEVFDVTSQ
jgi:hypothetical protein